MRAMWIGGFLLGCLLPAQPPSLAEVRKGMGIPSTEVVRGQQDVVGFASRPEQMARVWEMATAPPAPESFGPRPEPGVMGAILPHDDYLYAGRIVRSLAPLVTTRTVVLVGVFHQYRAFGARDRIIFDPYRAWRSPDGEIPVSSLREELLGAMKPGEALQDAAMHDREHSLEGVAIWLKHGRRDLEIVPILVPLMSFERMEQLAGRLGAALAESLARRGWRLGHDVAIVVSSDGVHYGADFRHTPFGAGGVSAFQKAMDRDRALLKGPLAGSIGAGKARAFFEACVDPADPASYRLTWCGRFAIPFGQLLLAETARGLKLPAPVGIPVAFGASVDAPELPVKALGLGATAPANLYHFVSYPGVAYVAGPARP